MLTDTAFTADLQSQSNESRVKCELDRAGNQIHVTLALHITENAVIADLFSGTEMKIACSCIPEMSYIWLQYTLDGSGAGRKE